MNEKVVPKSEDDDGVLGRPPFATAASVNGVKKAAAVAELVLDIIVLVLHLRIC